MWIKIIKLIKWLKNSYVILFQNWCMNVHKKCHTFINYKKRKKIRKILSFYCLKIIDKLNPSES